MSGLWVYYETKEELLVHFNNNIKKCLSKMLLWFNPSPLEMTPVFSFFYQVYWSSFKGTKWWWLRKVFSLLPWQGRIHKSFYYRRRCLSLTWEQLTSLLSHVHVWAFTNTISNERVRVLFWRLCRRLLQKCSCLKNLFLMNPGLDPSLIQNYRPIYKLKNVREKWSIRALRPPSPGPPNDLFNAMRMM